MVKAEESIVSSLQDAGWQTRRRPFSARQVTGNLDYGYFSPALYPELSGVNITALKPGQEFNNTLVIEARYDTVRMSPGADDNIASVAALLELARILKPYSFKQSVMLACCDMEELGFIGAISLVKELQTECRVRGAIIFETMAYTSKKPNSQSFPPGFERIYPGQTKRLEKRGSTGEGAIVIYRNSAKSLAVGASESLVHIAGPDSVMLLREPSDIPLVGKLLCRRQPATMNHFYRADQVPFWEASLPAIQVTDGANFRNPHYHKISDKPVPLIMSI
jgi:Zn-dependent M28 family amino/carboxypeptidase